MILLIEKANERTTRFNFLSQLLAPTLHKTLIRLILDKLKTKVDIQIFDLLHASQIHMNKQISHVNFLQLS